MRRAGVSCALLPDFGDLRGDPVVHHLQEPGLPTLESLRDEIRWEDENVAGLTTHGDLRAVLVGDDRPVEPEAVDKSLAEAETHGVDHVVRVRARFLRLSCPLLVPAGIQLVERRRTDVTACG